MPKKDLAETLAKVHSELAGAQSIDDDTRQLLTKLTEDIQRILEQDEPQSSDGGEPLSDQVADLMLQFETEHPDLTSALNQVAAALANLGI
ncbi:MAG: DUF4404 family protein [Planctomycetes bacterium]|nr:DUF4404 family protein [Planctomycetota bacterium]